MKRTTILASIIASIIIFLLITYVFIFHVQNRYLRDVWQQPEKILEIIGIEKGMVIGEAGAGKGYLTFKLAEQTGRGGHIYANDINEKALNVIRQRAEKENIENITIVKGEIADPLFPRQGLDMVVILLAFHDFTKKEEWLNTLKSYMRPQASLVIIERDPQRYWGGNRGHFLKKEQLLEIMEKANYKLQKMDTSLPRDNIYIYKIND